MKLNPAAVVLWICFGTAAYLISGFRAAAWTVVILMFIGLVIMAFKGDFHDDLP